MIPAPHYTHFVSTAEVDAEMALAIIGGVPHESYNFDQGMFRWNDYRISYNVKHVSAMIDVWCTVYRGATCINVASLAVPRHEHYKEHVLRWGIETALNFACNNPPRRDEPCPPPPSPPIPGASRRAAS